MTTTRLASAIGTAATEAVLAAIADPTRGLTAPAPTLDAGRVGRDVAKRVEPVLLHATNSEPFWRSRVFWGSAISLLTPVLAIGGITVGPAETETIVSVALAVPALVGGIVSLWGRFAATRPLGG